MTAVDQIINEWEPHTIKGTHSADCWTWHAACALRRLHGMMLIEIERLTVERDEARRLADEYLSDLHNEGYVIDDAIRVQHRSTPLPDSNPWAVSS